MKALSIRQPWAWLIVQGYKNLENRTWRLPDSMVGQRIAVHAGLKMGWGPGEDWIMERLTPLAQKLFTYARDCEEFHLGALVGEVTIVGPYDDSTPGWHSARAWYMGPQAFILTAAKPYGEPVPYKGHLGFFDLDLWHIPLMEEAT